MCRCLFCCLFRYKDIRGLIAQSCHQTLNVCIPLVMVAAAHAPEPAEWLKTNHKHILDVCYEEHNTPIVSWLIRENFYRDQVTYHCAVLKSSWNIVRLLAVSGCPRKIWVGSSYWHAAYNLLPQPVDPCWQSLGFDVDFKKGNVSTLAGYTFLSYRGTDNDMDAIYEANRKAYAKAERKQRKIEQRGHERVTSEIYF